MLKSVFALEVKGRSMRPVLRQGDVVIVQSAAPEDYQPGDIIVYRGADERLVVHRILRRPELCCRASFLTIGDNQLVRMRRVAPDRIAGKVVRVVRGGVNCGLPPVDGSLPARARAFILPVCAPAYFFLARLAYFFAHNILAGVSRAVMRALAVARRG